MLRLVREYNSFGQFRKVFLNDMETYEIFFTYSDKKNSLNLSSPNNIQISCIPKSGGKLDISIPFVHNEKTDKEINPFEILISRFLEEHRHFGEMENQTGDWADACRTVIEIDEKLRELHPGYFITNKRTY